MFDMTRTVPQGNNGEPLRTVHKAVVFNSRINL